jgi:hypothetical protein
MILSNKNYNFCGFSFSCAKHYLSKETKKNAEKSTCTNATGNRKKGIAQAEKKGCEVDVPKGMEGW